MTARDLKIYPNPNFWLCVHVQGKVNKRCIHYFPIENPLSHHIFVAEGGMGVTCVTLFTVPLCFFFSIKIQLSVIYPMKVDLS